MTSHGYDPRQSPGLRYKRIVSCKDSFHSTDGVRTPTQTSAGAKGRTASIHGPRRRGQPEHSHRGHPVPGPGNVAAKRCSMSMTSAQYAVAVGTATPEQRKIAKKQRRFIVVKTPYYPTVEDM